MNFAQVTLAFGLVAGWPGDPGGPPRARRERPAGDGPHPPAAPMPRHHLAAGRATPSYSNYQP